MQGIIYPKALKKSLKTQINGTVFRGRMVNFMRLKVVEGEVGKGIGFERIRRITGYLVGSVDRFNNGKRAEVEDRVKHSIRRGE